jgi:germacradienol/geosmin synthase
MNGTINGLKASFNCLLDLTKSEFQRKRLEDDWKAAIWVNLIRKQINNSLSFNNIESYLNLRRIDGGVKIYATILEVSLGYDFPIEVYERDLFLTLIDLSCDYICLINDLFSLRREIKFDDVPFNGVLVLGPDIEDNMKKAIEIIYEIEKKIMKVIEEMREENWVVCETNYMNQVLNYADQIINLCAGGFKSHRVSRYDSNI